MAGNYVYFLKPSFLFFIHFSHNEILMPGVNPVMFKKLQKLPK